MKQLMTFLLAFASWGIPFFVSIFFIDIETKKLSIDPIIFHGTLAVIFLSIVGTSYLILKRTHFLSLQTAHLFCITNILLDSIILLGILKAVSVIFFLSILVPFYLIGSYGPYYLVRRMNN